MVDSNFVKVDSLLFWVEGIGSLNGPNFLDEYGGYYYGQGPSSDWGFVLSCAFHSDGSQSFDGSDFNYPGSSAKIPCDLLTPGTLCNPFPVGIQENAIAEGLRVAVFPTHLVEVTSETENIDDLKVYSIQGKLVTQQPCASRQCIINTDSWPNGVFIIRIQLEDGITISKKIFK